MGGVQVSDATSVWLDEIRQRARRAAADGRKVKMTPAELERLAYLASTAVANAELAEERRQSPELRTLRACWETQQANMVAMGCDLATILETLPKLARTPSPFDGGDNG